MGKKSSQHEDRIYLDVDWLVGERSDPRLRLPVRSKKPSRIIGVALGLLLAVLGVIAWPTLSNHWLRYRIETALQSPKTSNEEALAMMLALNDLRATGSQAILAQLADPSAEKRNLAYRLLSEWISKGGDEANPIRIWTSLASRLKQHEYPLPESIQLRDALLFDMANRCDAMPESLSKQTLLSLCKTSISQSNVAESKGSNTSIRLSDLSQNSPGAASANLKSPINTSSSATSNSVVSQNVQDSAPVNTQVPLPKIPAPSSGGMDLLSNSVAGQEVPSSDALGSSRWTNVTLVSTTAPKAPDLNVTSGLPPDRTQSRRMVAVPVQPNNNSVATEHPPTSAVAAENADATGLDRLSLETLFTMLGSPQERKVRAVCDELFRRGVPVQWVETAMDLARGNPESQIQDLEQLVRSEGVRSLPFLSWMAENQHRDVRRRAITLLGAMHDPEAPKRLRTLFQREPDKQLQQLIQQALVAGGAK